jgi:hypothetical protein
MYVITDVVQLVLHYSKHIGGVLDILRTELPSEVPVELPNAVVWYAYRGYYNTNLNTEVDCSNPKRSRTTGSDFS